MFRTATPPMGQPVSATAAVPRDKVAQRAYEKWCLRGRPHGTDVQDWLEAEHELQMEIGRAKKVAVRR